jgi:hypothetical protein
MSWDKVQLQKLLGMQVRGHFRDLELAHMLWPKYDGDRRPGGVWWRCHWSLWSPSDVLLELPGPDGEHHAHDLDLRCITLPQLAVFPGQVPSSASPEHFLWELRTIPMGVRPLPPFLLCVCKPHLGPAHTYTCVSSALCLATGA